MEVEIKLRLPDAAAHRRLSSFLAPRLRRTHAQRNLFFDAAARTLAAATAALRVRLYGPDDRAPLRAVLALKRRPRIEASKQESAASSGRAVAPRVSWSARPSRIRQDRILSLRALRRARSGSCGSQRRWRIAGGAPAGRGDGGRQRG